MTSLKHFKIFFLYCLVFIVFLLIFAPINKAFALESKYPTISGSIDLNTATEVPLPDYVKYLFTLGMFIGFASVFISITLSGIAYLISPVYPGSELLAWAKDRFSGAISGLIILSIIYLIIVTINPQLSVLSGEKLPPAPAVEKTITPGAYFFQKDDCSGVSDSSQFGINDLGDLRNKINSVNIVQDGANSRYFIGVLYDNSRFSGKCAYILPNTSCQKVPAMGFSASVYSYDFEPNGDGVYFYRNSYFNEKGGYYKIDNKDIKGVYEKYLEDLSFTDSSKKSGDNPDGCTVPEEERPCKEYNKDGICQKRICPSLAGDNISSIYIHGNYVVLLLYIAKDDQPLDKSGPWSNCQEFPTIDDASKLGPTQIKWQPAGKSHTGLPNAVIIIPIKK